MIISGTAGARKVASLNNWAILYIQVQNAVNLRISNDAWTLTGQQYGNDQGLVIAQNDGIKKLQWRGDLWVVGDGSIFNLEIVQ